jgi:hypothetical protein
MLRASQAVAGEIDPLRVVNDAIENGVSVGGIADQLVPFVDWDLAGDDRRSANRIQAPTSGRIFCATVSASPDFESDGCAGANNQDSITAPSGSKSARVAGGPLRGSVKTAVQRLFAFGQRRWRICCATVTPGSLVV